MKVVIPGGSGQVGQLLARRFVARGDDVVVLARAGGVPAGRTIPWDGRTLDAWGGEDLARAIDFLVTKDDLAGPVNLAAPRPLPYRDFMRTLREAWGARVGLPAAKWMLDIGAWAMRTDTELVLKSRRVVPERLLGAGFRFDFEDWPAAARALVTAWRVSRQRPAPATA